MPIRSNSAPAIETLELRKVYDRKVALDGLSMAVAPGEVFGLLGPNGAGKSTLVKILMGLIYPSSGSARLLGRPIGTNEIKARVGFLPEQFRFHEWLRADEFLSFHAGLLDVPKPERTKRIREVLTLVGLKGRAGDRLKTFSKGMLQRIGIAQALLNDPDIVFLDEPTSALDPLGRREVRDLIRELKARGKTVFLNSHLLSEVEMVCDRVAIIDHGRVVRAGTLGELLSAEHELEVQAKNLPPELVERMRTSWPVRSIGDSTIILSVKDSAEIPRVARCIVDGGGDLYGLTARRGTLEDLFVEVVEGATEG
ncbi:MAG: ABC transporter ATP-binding protein [Chloroflexi bacterium]|nr:ABC transporter ATP-binding protein [Chloroflexota bacterium]